jgi:ABC-type nitrate/sulfonate/bicarbonate transport system permease component
MFIFIACVPFVYSDAAPPLPTFPSGIETARTLGASSLQIVRKVLVALALPDICNSLRHLFRPGVRLHHARRADQRAAQARLPADDQPAPRASPSTSLLILIIIGLLAYGIDRLLAWFQRGLFPYRTAED